MTDLPSAGRELDALVAEKVMGWRVDYDSTRHWTECGASVDDLVFTAPDSIFHGEQRIANVPHYSTDIATAWLVLMAMATVHAAHHDAFIRHLSPLRLLLAMPAKDAAYNICLAAYGTLRNPTK